MIIQMLKNAWNNFTSPFRTRPPITSWRRDLLDRHSKEAIAGANAEIKRQVQNIERELSLIARDHR